MTKLISLIVGSLALLTWWGCDTRDRYMDLSSGDYIEVEQDSATGYMVNAETRKPVYIYVDTRSDDTIYGRTGAVINGMVRSTGDGKWEYEDGEFTFKDGEYKMKTDGDGGYKIKQGDDYKKEVEKDGDITIKDGDSKIKIDGKTGERKVKNDD